MGNRAKGRDCGRGWKLLSKIIDKIILQIFLKHVNTSKDCDDKNVKSWLSRKRQIFSRLPSYWFHSTASSRVNFSSRRLKSLFILIYFLSKGLEKHGRILKLPTCLHMIALKFWRFLYSFSSKAIFLIQRPPESTASLHATFIFDVNYPVIRVSKKERVEFRCSSPTYVFFLLQFEFFK